MVLSILAVATGAADDVSAVAIAAGLAGRHGSCVTVVNSFTNLALGSPVMAAGSMSPAVWRSMVDEREAVVNRIESLTADQAKRFGLAIAPSGRASIHVAAPDTTPWAGLLRELPLADLVVVSQSCAGGVGLWAGPLGEALMDAKAAVFVARGETSAAGRTAVVAWDGSLEAGRAVRAALPLLREAGSVAIVQDPDEIDVAPGAVADPQRLNDYLTAHGVPVETTRETRGRKVGVALLEAATDLGAALLVAGAFGHSRIGEVLFGGATRSLLQAKSGPHLLIAH